MTLEEFLEWENAQEEKWELVDGYPVPRSDRWYRDPVTGMAGATFRHNRIASNILRHLGNRLGDVSCVALPSDQMVRSPSGNARYPDVVVECGTPANEAKLAQEPRVLFEVLSPSNTARQQLKLIADYHLMTTLQHVAFVEQTEPFVLLWTRNSDGWRAVDYRGLAEVLPLPAIQAELPVAQIYERISFDAPDA
jgi:Uma2 family endonuclease